MPKANKPSKEVRQKLIADDAKKLQLYSDAIKIGKEIIASDKKVLDLRRSLFVTMAKIYLELAKTHNPIDLKVYFRNTFNKYLATRSLSNLRLVAEMISKEGDADLGHFSIENMIDLSGEDPGRITEILNEEKKLKPGKKCGGKSSKEFRAAYKIRDKVVRNGSNKNKDSSQSETESATSYEADEQRLSSDEDILGKFHKLHLLFEDLTTLIEHSEDLQPEVFVLGKKTISLGANLLAAITKKPALEVLNEQIESSYSTAQ